MSTIVVEGGLEDPRNKGRSNTHHRLLVVVVVELRFTSDFTAIING